MLDVDFLAKGNSIKQHTLYEYSEAAFLKDLLKEFKDQATDKGLLIQRPEENAVQAAMEESLFGSSLVIIDWPALSETLTPKQIQTEQASLLKAIQAKTVPNNTISLWNTQLKEKNPDFPAHKKAVSTILTEPQHTKSSEVRSLFDFLWKTSSLIIDHRPSPHQDSAREFFASHADTLSKQEESPIHSLLDTFSKLALLCITEHGEFDISLARRYIQPTQTQFANSLMEPLYEHILNPSSKTVLNLCRAFRSQVSKGNEVRQITGLFYKVLHDLVTINEHFGVAPTEAGFSAFQSKTMERFRAIPKANLLKTHLALNKAEAELNTAEDLIQTLHEVLTRNLPDQTTT